MVSPHAKPPAVKESSSTICSWLATIFLPSCSQPAQQQEHTDEFIVDRKTI